MRLASILHAFAPAAQPWHRLATLGAETGAFLAYWVAVVLPLAYLLVLPATAFDLVDLTTVVAIATLHAVAVIAGQYHEPD